jgi:hypothetical protein
MHFDQRPYWLIVAILCGLWVLASPVLCISAFLARERVFCISIAITGFISLGMAAIAINRLGPR